MSLISIDFDGTICKRSGIPRTSGIDNEKPIKYAKEAILYLMSKGHEIYIQSNRNPDEILIWLKANEFPLVEITDHKKPNTAVYIDDRAIRFENNWQSICKLFG